MFIRKVAVIAICFFVSISVFAQQDQAQMDYVEKYKDIAIREMERAGIPASIKLAQGLLESNAGRSTLATRANNHFGIKCGGGWEGREVYREDDDYDAQGNLIKSCFRGYKNSQASFIAHSEFLRDPKKTFRYGFLFRLDHTDYQRWARGLKQAGYATSATYSEKLISLIERYELHKYDNMTTVILDTPSEIISSAGILKNNDVSYVIANDNETLESIAQRADVSIRNLIAYNENITGSTQRMDEGDRVYLQPKRNSFRGREKFHVVETGETMFDISQQYGVNLDKLYNRNRLGKGEEPAPEERIKLRGCSVKEAPRLYSAVEIQNPTPTPVPDGEDLEMEEPDEVFIPSQPTTTPPPTTEPAQPEVPVIIINNPPTSTPSPNTTEGSLPPVLEEPDFDDDLLPPGNSGTTTSPTTTTQPPTQVPSTNTQYHVVKQGDTLWSISKRYNLTVDQLKNFNQLANNNIKIGDRLRVK